MEPIHTISMREVILFKIDSETAEETIFGLNRYNGLERIVVGSIELKRYNDSSNRYTFHESL
jgi:hypothetical protein